MRHLKREFKFLRPNARKTKCVCIQSPSNPKTNMQFKSLLNHEFDEEMFIDDSNDLPKRMMYYHLNSGHEETMCKEFPMLSDIYSKNLELCSDYVRYETSIRTKFIFQGHNILANYKGIREQYLHNLVTS